MKILVVTIWGTNSNSLHWVYQAYSKINVTKFGLLLLKATVLNKVKNKSLPVVLGATKTTPIAALETQINCPLLENRT